MVCGSVLWSGVVLGGVMGVREGGVDSCVV